MSARDRPHAIARAAIRFDGAVWSVEPPGRHHTVIHAYCLTTGRRSIPPQTEQSSVQGFVTTDGVFVNREEAAAIAFAAGQIPQPKRWLFSEDVW